MARSITITLTAVDNYSSTLGGFKSSVDGISDSNRQLGQSTDNVDSSLTKTVSSINTMAVAWLGWRGINAVVDMFNLGQSVNIASSTFGALTANIGGSAANLQALREVTGGVVDDMTLMQGSAKMLQMGIASNTDELSGLMSMATKLGSAMGMDVTKSLSDFSLMLANNSIMRLDQFGIASGRVREKMEELKNSFPDMDKSERFKLAVLDEGAKALARLGGAATAAETPINRIAAGVQNMAQSFAGDFATGANSLIGILEIVTGNYPGQYDQQDRIEQAATANATVYAKTFWDAADTQLAQAQNASAFFTEDVSNKLIKDVFAKIKSQPSDMAHDAVVTNSINDVMNDFMNKYANQGDAEQFSMINTSLMNVVGDAQKAQDLQDLAKAQEEAAKALADQVEQARLLRSVQEATDLDKQQSLETQRQALEVAQQHRDVTIEYQNAVSQVGSELMNIAHIQDPMAAMYTGKITSDQAKDMMPAFMRPEAAQAITQQFKDAQDELVRLHHMADEKLISDDQITQAENLTDNLGKLADAAQTAADNFKNLKLAQALGQGGGGMQGEMTDLIMQQMKEAGASQETIDAMQAQLDLQSGRETESSQELKTKIVPLIAKMSASHAAVAVANLDAYLKEATLQGLTPEAIAAALPDVIASGEGQGGVNGKETDTFSVSGGYAGGAAGPKTFGNTTFSPFAHMNKDDGKNLASATVAGDMASINKDSTTVDKNFTTISKNADLAAKATTVMKDMLSKIPDKKPIQFQFSSSDPEGLIPVIRAVMGGVDLGAAMADQTRSNGGVPPGSTGDNKRYK